MTFHTYFVKNFILGFYIMQELTDFLADWWIILLPLVVIQLGLFLFAAIDIGRKRQTKTLSPLIWIIIVVCVNTVGAVLYLIFGRADSVLEDDDDYKNY